MRIRICLDKNQKLIENALSKNQQQKNSLPLRHFLICLQVNNFRQALKSCHTLYNDTLQLKYFIIMRTKTIYKSNVIQNIHIAMFYDLKVALIFYSTKIRLYEHLLLYNRHIWNCQQCMSYMQSPFLVGSTTLAS